MLRQKIVELKESLISQANTVEKMIEKSIKGLIDKNGDLLKEVLEVDEKLVNTLELKIDETCTNLIALYHPEAKDLRTVLMISKMTSDLERIGDCAVNISESALYLIDKPQVKPYIDLPRMADEAIKMVKDSITSFINENVELAKNVCERDNIVDDLRDQILRELITYMFSDPSTIERSLQLLRIANNLEKVGDISTNISEETIYMAKGKVIKHYQEQV
ncbi:MAG: phosphate transport system regulatory protein PhoU [Spirochaetes bacterium GWD1_27_9]|nr:MAG: phosphate transport system regulatory protein PhoU [Spirochaetes bacterium GWB1_27_13]OHD21493.1 MAG: phosphate transport system regulatory protein PhoU [Spirochaetes bacterium GWC1_27_15]OHD44847.1 MAG: phosphate transport system regulatory protein PhoU [Spirochaetes bacterium GWD1_27_9]